MYKHGHKDRDCCDAHQFKAGRMMRSRTLRDSLIFGTRVVRHKGLKVDDNLRVVEYKGHSRPIRDSIVYGMRDERCRHKQCTAWHHFHHFNEELEKWDFPDEIATNQSKRELWLAARKSVLDQADIRSKSIPRDRYGELGTDAGHYAGEFLRALLSPWDYGNHPHDMYRAARPSFLTDLNYNDLRRTHYDPRPEAIRFHEGKIKELKEWQRVKLLERDMKWELLRIQGIQRCRHHFQHLKDRLQKAKVLWSELNRNSVWFVPWPEGDHVPELVRRSLMMISKRLSTCAPMWNPNFADLEALDNYLTNLDDLAPELWERFHYNCKLHKHIDHHERRASRLESIRRALLPPQPEPPIQVPLCEPVIALQNQIAALIAALPEHLKSSPKAPSQEALTEEVEASPERPPQGPKDQSKRSTGSKSFVEADVPEVGDSKPNEIPPSKGRKTKEDKSRAHALKELQALDVFDEKMGEARTNLGKGGKGKRSGKKKGKGNEGGKSGKEGKGGEEGGKKKKGGKV